MKINCTSGGDQEIIIESNDEIKELKSLIKIFIYNSVCETNNTTIYINYDNYDISINAICEIDNTYFYISSYNRITDDDFIGVCLDKKDVSLKEITKLAYKQFLLTIKYSKNKIHSSPKKENIEVL